VSGAARQSGAPPSSLGRANARFALHLNRVIERYEPSSGAAAHRVCAFHTVSHDHPPGGPDVYHNVAECTQGQMIRSPKRRDGTGGRVLCSQCAQHSNV